MIAATLRKISDSLAGRPVCRDSHTERRYNYLGSKVKPLIETEIERWRPKHAPWLDTPNLHVYGHELHVCFKPKGDAPFSEGQLAELRHLMLSIKYPDNIPLVVTRGGHGERSVKEVCWKIRFKKSNNGLTTR